MEKRRFFQKVGKTRVIPISAKILLIFAILLLFSNFATNYINIVLHRKETMDLTNQMLVRDLKDMYINAGNQYEIFLFSGDRDSALAAISGAAAKDMIYEHSWALGVAENGLILFQAESGLIYDLFPDMDVLREMQYKRADGINEGACFFNSQQGEYFGVYKYNSEWECFLIRADLMSDMMSASNTVFLQVSVIIVFLTVLLGAVGFIALLWILRFIGKISTGLQYMQTQQGLNLIDLKDAPNDDVTYLGISFNALSATMNNLLTIFRKFVSKDVVTKAYEERQVNLEGVQKELTILFSDIKGFTYMTETLGNDIINLLNLHYDRAIRVIHEQQGVIGSIIGDAVLAVYGAIETYENKSVAAVESAWEIQTVVAELRGKMFQRRNTIETTRALTPAEERVFKAVLLDIGIGIDGGTVFYGNIGSSEHMTNTVIGDSVNLASRMEGLTRLYRLPVIVSSYVKDEVESSTNRYKFFEIDTVLVKGKNEGTKLWFPLDINRFTPEDIGHFELFAQGLQAYYEGDWKTARSYMKKSVLDVAEVFIERMGRGSAPEDWSGIWTMTTK
ncbi:adenylate/guanylate cyclase domain-containing protein [Brucepastera parasyntrophica]|uniref:adenylate/guanylate cyclase domain-containing protein n=1 Tax=Brucepastera parasyntrophica TaxID=2880008 RepID=UPI002109CBB0|nr:adenylate/guanylate cyclase domain-containing protein [Brucepastera parasyntrophica]ULQ60730.1 adenylate/guanylate cyclase domain-containing protein [Brucepastera parasyntrophica]